MQNRNNPLVSQFANKRILMLTHHRRFKANWRCLSLARQLAQRGHKPTMICTSNKDHLRLTERFEDGVRIVEAPDLSFGQLRSGWDPWTTRRRIKWLQGQKFDLIHMFETRPASIYPALAYLKRHRVPVVIDWIDWWGHGGLITEHRPGWYQWLFEKRETWYEEHFRALADSSTVIARGLIDRAVGLGVDSNSIYWIPNGCSPESCDEARSQSWRSRFDIPEDKFVVGFSALDVTIGLDTLIKAISILRERHPDVLLLITGKESRELQQVIESQPEGSIRHMGFVAREDYARVLSCVDTFVVPFIDRVANQGRWPGRINDYLSLGKPLITNPVGEMETLLTEHSIGLLCGESPEDYARALSEMIKDESMRLRMGSAARQLAETKLAWSTLIDQLEASYAYANERARRRSLEIRGADYKTTEEHVAPRNRQSSVPSGNEEVIESFGPLETTV